MPFRLPPSPTTLPSTAQIEAESYGRNPFGARRGPPISVPGDSLLPPSPVILPQERTLMRTVYSIANAMSPDSELAPKTGRSRFPFDAVGTVGAMRVMESFRRSENVEDVRDIPTVEPAAGPIMVLLAQMLTGRRQITHRGGIDPVVVPPSPQLDRVPPTSQIAKDAGLEDLKHKFIFAPPPRPRPPENKNVPHLRTMSAG